MSTATIRNRLHAYIDVVQAADLPALLWIVLRFAAPAMNQLYKKSKEVKPNETHQA